jgi:hypothetical protein
MTTTRPQCRRWILLALVTAAFIVAAPRRSVAKGLSDMISPLSVPTINEDPRITSEIRPIFMYTGISNDFVTSGGHYVVTALQARLALTDRLGLIATKDGYIFLWPHEAVPSADGFANIAFGLKGVLFEDVASASILSAGLRYEAPSGEQDVFQGRGDGLLNPFLSGAKGYGNLHVQAYTGPRLAISSSDSSFYDLSLHADYRVAQLYPLVEFNWIRVLRGGERLPIDQEGFDLVDIGSENAGGESVATLAFGTGYRLIEQVDVGVAAEFPVTGREDIFGWRVTTDLIWRFF